LRLFSGLIGAQFPIPAELGAMPALNLELGSDSAASIDPSVDPDAWDAALDLTPADELFARPDDASPSAAPQPEAMRSGLSQIDRYLSRTWARAGLPPQKHDDCTQAVYVTLLKHLSRPGFDELMVAVGAFGIREVFSRERDEGTVFFRAIDATKKRAQRERKLRSLDDGPDDPTGPIRERDWADALAEAIDRALNPREAELIRATLAGETPAEIAERWGVAPKTVSNEKTRAYHKLREFLTDGDWHS
jgi:RNA polymerase sigma factor (sigma-70 family)